MGRMKSVSARDVILGRRAAFVAATLGTLGVSATARAACTEETPETKAAVSEAARLEQLGEVEKALLVLDGAARSPDVLFRRGYLLRELGRWAAARRALNELLQCARPVSAEQRSLAISWELELAQRTVQINLTTHRPSGSEIFVDGVSVGTTPLADPIFVEAGALPPDRPQSRWRNRAHRRTW